MISQNVGPAQLEQPASLMCTYFALDPCRYCRARSIVQPLGPPTSLSSPRSPLTPYFLPLPLTPLIPDYQEDRARQVDDFNALVPESTTLDRSIRRALYCIFDGHGGDACSSYCHETFHKVLAENAKIGEDPKAALLETWDIVEKGFEEKILARYERNKKNFKPKNDTDKVKFPCDGSTATVCLIVGNLMYVAR